MTAARSRGFSAGFSAGSSLLLAEHEGPTRCTRRAEQRAAVAVAALLPPPVARDAPVVAHRHDVVLVVGGPRGDAEPRAGSAPT